jgi:dCTP diphosphatase
MTDIIDIAQLKQLLQEFADARDWNQYHNPKNLSMALAVEAGELLEIFQWMTDSESKNARYDDIIKEKVSHELADVMLYLIQIATQMDINISHAITTKLAINKNKYPA